MKYLVNSPLRAYQFRIVVLFVTIAVALIGLSVYSPDSAVARPAVPQQQTSGYYWGSDTNAYKTNPDEPLYFPSQDFYIGQLGSGLGGPGTGTQGFTFSGTPPQATYAYWTLLGPNPQAGSGKGGMTDSEWGRAQAQRFIAEVTTGSFSNTIKGKVLFADIEGTLNGTSPGSWLPDDQAANMNVVNGFLNEIAASQTFVPGIYTSPGFWAYCFGQNSQTDVPFVLWISHWLSKTYYPSNPSFPSLIPQVEAWATDQYLLESIAGYYPVIWQFGGIDGDLAIQNPAQGFIPRSAGRAGFDQFAFGPNDDGTYPCTSMSAGTPSNCTPQAQDIGFDINFLGTTYRNVYINNNGNLTFDAPLATYTPFGLAGTNRVIIAPFFADVDTRVGPTVTFGRGTINNRQVFVVNWPGVGCYSEITTVRNGFQVVLINRSDRNPGDFDIEFNYDQIQWDSGEASGGDTNCLGGTSARVGYSNGSNLYKELVGSGVPNAFLDSGPYSLIHRSEGSILQPGRYVFEVKNGAPPAGGGISGLVQTNAASPVSGAYVQACNSGTGACNTTNTGASGQYAIDGLNAGQYLVTAYSPGGTNLLPGTLASITVTSDSTVANQDIALSNPLPLPSNTQVTSRTIGSGGIPIVYWHDDLSLITSGCPGGTGSYQILQNGSVLRSGSLVESTAGVYSATVPSLYPAHGYASVSTQILCSDSTTQTGTFDIYIDPSGTVRDMNGNPISNATVTLYRSDDAAGPFALVPDGSGIMSVANRKNPDMTDATGRFGWDVFAGFYQVRAEKAGCVSPNDPTQPFVESVVLSVPPAVTDLDLRLNCTPAPPDLIFANGFESGDWSAWSAAVTNTGNLSVSAAAALVGNYGLRATINSTSTMYVRNDTPANEARYRARFYFDPNSVTLPADQDHDIFAARTSSGVAFRVQVVYASGIYQIRAKIRNDSGSDTSTASYPISDAPHFVEVDWAAATAPGANDGYLSLWLDGVLKQTISGVDNDTMRIEEARLGPSGSLDAGMLGTEYYDAFESRRSTYIGPVGVAANFTASPVQGLAPLTVTFTNLSQADSTITAYLWKFGDGYTSTITNPVHTYASNGYFTVTLTAFAGTTQNTITKTTFITASDLIFANGFETGDWSAWSAAVTNTGNLSVSTAAALVGNYGLRATINNTSTMYVRNDTPANEARYRARFYFDPNSVTLPAGEDHDIFAGRTSSGIAFRVQLVYASGVYQIRAKIRNDSGSDTSTASYPISDAPHFIEVDWAAATTPGANDGYLSLWLDGVLKQTISGVDNDTMRIEEARLGPSGSLDAGMLGTEYYDAFESRRSTYIGPAGQ